MVRLRAMSALLSSNNLRMREHASPINDVIGHSADEFTLDQRDASLGHAMYLLAKHYFLFDVDNRDTHFQIGTFGCPGCGKSRFISELIHRVHRGARASELAALARALPASNVPTIDIPEFAAQLSHCEAVAVTWNHCTPYIEDFDGRLGPETSLALRLLISYFFQVDVATFGRVFSLIGENTCKALKADAVVAAIIQDSGAKLLVVAADELVAAQGRSDPVGPFPKAARISSILGALHKQFFSRDGPMVISVVTTLDLLYDPEALKSDSGRLLEIVALPFSRDDAIASAVPKADLARRFVTEAPFAYALAACSSHWRTAALLYKSCLAIVAAGVPDPEYHQLIDALLTNVVALEEVRPLTAALLAPALLGCQVPFDAAPNALCQMFGRTAVRFGYYNNSTDELSSDKKTFVPRVSAIRALVFAGYKVQDRPKPVLGHAQPDEKWTACLERTRASPPEQRMKEALVLALDPTAEAPWNFGTPFEDLVVGRNSLWMLATAYSRGDLEKPFTVPLADYLVLDVARCRPETRARVRTISMSPSAAKCLCYHWGGCYSTFPAFEDVRARRMTAEELVGMLDGVIIRCCHTNPGFEAAEHHVLVDGTLLVLLWEAKSKRLTTALDKGSELGHGVIDDKWDSTMSQIDATWRRILPENKFRTVLVFVSQWQSKFTEVLLPPADVLPVVVIPQESLRKWLGPTLYLPRYFDRMVDTPPHKRSREEEAEEASLEQGALQWKRRRNAAQAATSQP